MNRSTYASHSFRKHPIIAASALAPALEERAGDALEDLKLFATGWLGGLVFFGTFLA